MVLNSFKNAARCSASVGCSSTGVRLVFVICAYVYWPSWTGVFVLKEWRWGGCVARLRGGSWALLIKRLGAGGKGWGPWFDCFSSLPSFCKRNIPCSSRGNLRHRGHISLDCASVSCSLLNHVDHRFWHTGQGCGAVGGWFRYICKVIQHGFEVFNSIYKYGRWSRDIGCITAGTGLWTFFLLLSVEKRGITVVGTNVRVNP
jgi:hypothetical protein